MQSKDSYDILEPFSVSPEIIDDLLDQIASQGISLPASQFYIKNLMDNAIACDNDRFVHAIMGAISHPLCDAGYRQETLLSMLFKVSECVDKDIWNATMHMLLANEGLGYEDPGIVVWTILDSASNTQGQSPDLFIAACNTLKDKFEPITVPALFAGEDFDAWRFPQGFTAEMLQALKIAVPEEIERHTDKLIDASIKDFRDEPILMVIENLDFTVDDELRARMLQNRNSNSKDTIEHALFLKVRDEAMPGIEKAVDAENEVKDPSQQFSI